MSGYGAGVEDLSLGFGKLALSYLAGARPDITTENGSYIKSTSMSSLRREGTRRTLGAWFDFATSKGHDTAGLVIQPVTDMPSECATSVSSGTAAITLWNSIWHRGREQFQHFGG